MPTYDKRLAEIEARLKALEAVGGIEVDASTYRFKVISTLLWTMETELQLLRLQVPPEVAEVCQDEALSGAAKMVAGTGEECLKN